MSSSWFEAYLGLIFQVYGLAFFVLGVAALLSMRRDTSTGLSAHLGWLAAFGMLHGMQEFIDGERLHNPAAWLVVLSTTLMVVSFLALLEFGRRLWNEWPSDRRLAALPLYTATGLGTVALMLAASTVAAGLEVGARYLLGAPGATLAGIGLLAQARATPRAPDTVAIIRWLHITALAMLGYAALTLFLSPGSGPLVADWLPTTADFLATAGLPVQLVRALCAVLLAVGFIIFNRRSVSLAAVSLRRVTNRLDGFVYRCRNDQNWSVSFMSEGGEILTGYPSQDFLRGERHFADQIHPDDQQRVWTEVQVALAARRDFRLQYRMFDRAGTVRWCYEEGRGVFDTRGELLYMEGLVRNDDARHQALQALQQERDFAKSLLDTAPVIILLMDPQGMIRHVNPWFEQLTGYRLDEIVGKEWFATFLPVRDQACIRELFARALHDQPVRGNINPIVTRDGEELAIEWHAMPLHDSDGLMIGLLSIGMDVTERQQLENQLHELNQSLEQRVAERTAEAERANAAKSEFLSRMSHELRTPLNAILGFTQLLQLPGEQSLSTQQADNVHEIHHAGEHLLGLVNEILDLTRIESGHLELNLEPLALIPVIERSAKLIIPAAEQRGISITLPSQYPCTVLADPGRLSQVLLNLFSNAVKFNRKGGSITVDCLPVAGLRMRVSVRDTGLGLSADQMARLFRPFERLESAYEGIEGTGIGLALVKQLIQGMQGHVGVSSEPGTGSCFWFELPLCEPSVEKAPNEEPVVIDPPVAAGGQHIVLYIEDNQANLRLVQKILAKHKGIELLTAENGEQGLQIAVSKCPQLILLDINLPGMDGFAVLKQLQATPNTKYVPVIAISANAMQGDIERAEAAGFADYITKPIQIPAFLKSILHCLQKNQPAIDSKDHM